jgi:hypothetical protein
MSATIERWNIFLKKISDRAQEYFVSAREQSLPLFKKNNGDPLPVSTALHAIHLQLVELNQKIDDTWEQQVDPLLEKERVAQTKREELRRLGSELQHKINCDFRLLEIEIYYSLALHILELAEQHKVEAVPCTQCSAPLNIPEHTYTAERIVCKFCQTVNTYEPGTYGRMVGSFCAQNIAHWHAQDLLKAEMNIEGQLQYLRDEEYEEGKRQLRIAHHAFSEKFLKECKKYLPNLDVEKELEYAMRHF